MRLAEQKPMQVNHAGARKLTAIKDAGAGGR
jgi:hypothetical protein